MTGERQPIDIQQPAPGKDSFLRVHTQELVDLTSDAMVDKFPNLTPTEISVFGTLLVIIGGKILEHENRRAEGRRASVIAVGLVMEAIGVACDVLDGGVARAKNRKIEKIKDVEVVSKKNKKVDTKRGKIVDIVMDRLQEVVLAADRADSATKRGSRLGEAAARLTELSTTLPSTAKLDKERQGVSIPELGSNPLAMLGSRPGRIGIVFVNNLFPSAQKYLDSAGAGANLYSAIHRFRSRGKKDIPETEKKYAVAAEVILAGIEIAAFADVIYFRSKKDRRKSAGSYLPDALKAGILDAVIPLAVILALGSQLETDQLQVLQRKIVPSKKWRRKQPDHRDALRLLKNKVNSGRAARS